MKRSIVSALTLVLGLLLALPLAAQNLPSAKPKEVGLSSERLARLVARIKADSEKGVIPGAVVIVARHGKVALYEAIGFLDPQTKTPMPKDAIFRIYSMSKPIASVAAMQLVEEGKLGLDQPVGAYIPSFAKQKIAPLKAEDGKPVEFTPARRPMTVQDLLRHSSGITYGFFGEGVAKKAYVDANLFANDNTNAEFAELIAVLPLAFEPGTTWDYSHSTDILGRVIEVATGKSLLAAEKERVLDPLGMKDTNFYVTDKTKHGRIAEPFANDRAIGGGIMFFDPRLAGKWESAGGGMMGTAMDYARFLQMLLNGGELEGKRIISKATVAFMTADHMGSIVKPGPYYLPGAGYGFGLGFAVRLDNGVSPIPGTAGDYYWGGAGGTYFWVDPKQDMFVILMLQSPKMRVPYRTLIRDMVYGAVIK